MELLSKLFKKTKAKKRGMVKEWSFIAEDTITTSPSINKAGSMIIFGTKNGKIYALDNKGKKKWVYTIKKELTKEELFFLEEESFRQVSAKPIIADLNNDQKDKIIVSSESGSLFVLSHEGKLIWNFSVKDAIKASALVEDINNDKKYEVVFGTSDSFVYALNNKGKLLWTFKAGSGIESTPSIIKEKQTQIIFGSNDGTIYSLDKNGKLLWTFKAGDKITAQPAIGKLDNNHNSCIIVGSLDSNLYALDDKGNLIWKYPTEGKIFSKALILDINNDKRPEILVGSCDDKLHVISNKGNKIWDYETDFWVVSSPLAVDVDNDNKLEIVIGSYDSFVYVLDAEGRFVLDYMPGISSITQQSGHYFDVMTKEPGSFYGKLLYKYKAGSMITGLESLPDGQNGILTTTNTRKLDKIIYLKK